MKFIKNVFLLMMLMFSFNVSASSPEWITHVTKGKVNYTQAKQITKWVYLYSVANDLDPNLVFKVIKVESTFRKTARSKKDGKGLMQIVPKWHKDKIKVRNIYDIRTNIEVGTSILR
jgi:soluble lytic murein transglycosylase-like protein